MSAQQQALSWMQVPSMYAGHVSTPWSTAHPPAWPVPWNPPPPAGVQMQGSMQMHAGMHKRKCMQPHACMQEHENAWRRISEHVSIMQPCRVKPSMRA
eukprot:366431-Chlamydomonas_euryale.AAC.22